MDNFNRSKSPLIPVIIKSSNSSVMDAKGYISSQNIPEKSIFKPNNADNVYASNKLTLSLSEINSEDIIPNRFQPRKAFNSNSLIHLSDSIKRYGILQPITVRPIISDDKIKYEIICGERRYRAGLLAGLDVFTCRVLKTDDMATAELSIIENLLREDLNIFEQAEALNLLLTTFSMTQQQVADKISLSQSAVANKIRLLKFSKDERKAIIENSLTERHARALLKLENSALRIKFINFISKDKLNVAETEQLIDNYLDYKDKHAESVKSSQNDKQKSKKVKGIFKDVRIFSNSIEKAADILRKSGFSVETSCTDNNSSYIYTITINKISSQLQAN